MASNIRKRKPFQNIKMTMPIDNMPMSVQQMLDKDIRLNQSSVKKKKVKKNKKR
jgi:hypothetical protein